MSAPEAHLLAASTPVASQGNATSTTLSEAAQPIKADIFLRVYISDAGSTVVHANESMLISDLLLTICTKRGLNSADLKLGFVFRDGTENMNIPPDNILGNYPNIDFAKMVHKDTGQFMRMSINNLHSSSGGSNGAEISAKPIAATRSLKEEIRSTVFPKAFSAFSSASTSSLGSSKQAGGALFKKQHSGTGDSLTNESSKLQVDGIETMHTGLASPHFGITSITTETSSVCASELDSAICRPSELDRQYSVTSEKKLERTSSILSVSSNTEKLERDASSPKPAFLSTKGAILKKASFRNNRSRTNTGDSIQEVSGQADQSVPLDPQKSAVVFITLPNFRSIKIRALKELPLDAILSWVCDRHHVEFDNHTFQRNDTKDTRVEMDRTLGYMIDDLSASELFIVPDEKVYRSRYMCENGVDVLMFQTIQGRLQVMAGTPQRLIARLTEHDTKDDPAFVDTFLLTFRYFMPANGFFRDLVARYNCTAPEDGTVEDVEYFNAMKGPTQNNVVTVLKIWVANHWHDFALDTELKNNLLHFADEFLYNEDQNIRNQSSALKSLVDLQTSKYEEMYDYYKFVERKTKVLESMILDLAPEVLSQQICVHNFKLFKNIHPIEFLHQIWGSDKEMTPYLNFFIDRFDKESYWVATEIVMQKDIKKRIKVLANFIHTTKACQEANNFFTLFSFMSGLGLSPVSRLKKTWEGLPEKSKAAYAELEKIIDPSRNMKNYRDLLAKAAPPIVPFLHLTFMNDGNPKMVEGMINFEKLRMMGNRVNDIVQLVEVEYRTKPEPHIQNYVAKPPVEKNIAKLKEMSLECEKV